MQGNLGLGLNLGDEVGQSLLRVGRLPAGRVIGLVADEAPLTTEVVLTLDEVDGDVEAGQLQGRREARGAAAEDQGAAGEGLVVAVGQDLQARQGFETGGPGPANVARVVDLERVKWVAARVRKADLPAPSSQTVYLLMSVATGLKTFKTRC